PRTTRPHVDLESGASPARPARVRTALQPPPASSGHLECPAAVPASPADHRSSHNRAPGHPPTRSPRRPPARVRACRLIWADEVFGTRTVRLCHAVLYFYPRIRV